MRFYNDVIVRRGSKYWIGKVKRMIFEPTEELKSLEVLDKLGIRYITLYDYTFLIGEDLTKKEIDEIRKKIGYTEVWVIDSEPPKPNKSKDISDTTWERWYFKFTNIICKKCKRTCKQSSRVYVENCPLFEKIK
jgi:hypothetical protein